MLLVLFGPPAVGKMTIGRAVVENSSFRLFHNHMTIEPLLETFGHGTPPFNTLNTEFRRRVLEEAAGHGVDLIFSVVWALDSQDDLAEMQSYIGIFESVAFVELRADLTTRLARNRTAERLLHKASKRDVEWSDDNVRQMESEWQMTSADGYHVAGDLLARHPHLVLDTVGVPQAGSAARIIEWVATLRDTSAT
ncbi:AAA family ATPase [Ornithinimicrobium cerasi]|uniref:AAA domain-containing protein n=1 Tax=Ornithinimicrobium cerasi TaxID=2248773 RepID=A0A285VMI6_9MICO|nr:AAA family ATPase [Ornithinimicrobium cerasi]SOC55279.1 AAA domain-containing protein [Ornithinimicrobium cerasi]